ncbi:MAG: discoidin domain-containing protein [Gaiella sp.]|nr:discoidin domain-containing protein [Gaiella sp.]
MLASRPDPCRAPPGPTNLALGRPATASSAAQAPAANAVDGNPATNWGSGADAPQWIEIDLQQAASVGSVRLRVAQYPAEGATAHRVWTRVDGAGDYVLR